MISLWELIRVDKYASADELKIFFMNLEVYGSNYKLPKPGYQVKIFDYQNRREEATQSTANLAFRMKSLAQEFR